MIRVKYIFCFFLILPYFINAQEENQINEVTHQREVLVDDFINFFQEEFGHFVESFFALSTCNRTEIYYFGAPETSISIAQKTLEFLGCNDYVRDGLYFFNEKL